MQALLYTESLADALSNSRAAAFAMATGPLPGWRLHTAGGRVPRPGELQGISPQSGPNKGEQSCLLGLIHGELRPLALPGDAQRRSLEDGDTVLLGAWRKRSEAARIDLGECRGTVMSACTRARRCKTCPARKPPIPSSCHGTRASSAELCWRVCLVVPLRLGTKLDQLECASACNLLAHVKCTNH
jgi:hypothetical protein